MTRALRMALVLLLATSILVVIPGEVDATAPGAIGRIVYVSDADHVSGEIYVREFAGSSPIRLTNNTEHDRAPVWSPDGTQIAFYRGPSKGPIDLFVMDSDGSNQINLSNGVGTTNIAVDWSPDGTRILFYSDRGGGNTDLWVVRPDGSDPQQLTNTPTDNEGAASWSSDGSLIVYERGNGIWIMDADGSNPRPLLARTEPDGDPAWSPDGSKIAFTSYYSGINNVWIMNADGSQPYSLTNSAGWESYQPAWAPDGSKIAFTSTEDGDADIWMMNADGSSKAHLTDHPAEEGQMDWESVNRNPVTVDDEATTHRSQSVQIDLLGNDYDPDGETLTLGDISRMPNEGTVTINPSGTVTYTHNGMTVSPGHALIYTDSFDYRVDDARLGSSIGTVQVWISPYFDDVPQSNVFFDDVVWLAVQRVTRGCNPPDNTLFCPGEPVTRGQMAAFLVRALHYTAGAGSDLFGDDNGSIFELDIDRLGTAGVTRGCNPPVNDRFCPDALVTRGQMAAFLTRAFRLTNLGPADLFVDDDGSIFEVDIDKLGATGVSQGCNPPTNDRFCPDDYVTREQMAAFLYRAVTWGDD